MQEGCSDENPALGSYGLTSLSDDNDDDHHHHEELSRDRIEGSRDQEQGQGRIEGVPTHEGRYLQYNVCGDLFHVTANYQPPFELISRGGYGVVCSAMNAETNHKVAIKKVPNIFDNLIHAKRILREIKILGHLDHPNVLALNEVIPPSERENFKDVYIVTEFMDMDLHHIITAFPDLADEYYQFFTYQLLKGLKYIHSAKVLHRDLKPSNLLVNLDDCHLKIADFGLARTFSETDEMTEYVVTRWYRPPELLFGSKEYTAAVDLWSVGCILMELYITKPLFPGKDHIHQIKSIIELMGCSNLADMSYINNEKAKHFLQQFPRFPSQPLAQRFPHVPPLAIDLVEKMLVFNPLDRITAEQALAHPYLSSMHNEADEPICPAPFSMDVDEHSLSEDDIQHIIYQMACSYH